MVSTPSLNKARVRRELSPIDSAYADQPCPQSGRHFDTLSAGLGPRTRRTGLGRSPLAGQIRDRPYHPSKGHHQPLKPLPRWILTDARPGGLAAQVPQGDDDNYLFGWGLYALRGTGQARGW